MYTGRIFYEQDGAEGGSTEGESAESTESTDTSTESTDTSADFTGGDGSESGSFADGNDSGDSEGESIGESTGEKGETSEGKYESMEPPAWLKQAKKEYQDREDLWSHGKIDDLIRERDELAEKAQSAPEVPDEYDLKLDENSDEELTKKFAEEAKEKGLTQEQFDFAVQKANEITKQQIYRASQYITDGYNAEKAKELFQGEWGNEFDKKYSDVRRGVKVLGDGFERVLNKTGLGNNPSVIRALADLGEKFSEDMTPLSESEGGMVDDKTAMLKERYPSMFK